MVRCVSALVLLLCLVSVDARATRDLFTDGSLPPVDSASVDTSLARQLRLQAIDSWQEPGGLAIIERLDSVLAILEHDSDPKVRRVADQLRGDQLGLYAANLADKGRFVDAMGAFGRSLKWFEQKGDTGSMSITHNNIGYMLQGLDEHRSIRSYQEALRLADTSPELHDLARSVRLTLAERFLVVSELDSAVKWFNTVPEPPTSHGDMAFWHLLSGQIAEAQGTISGL